MAEVRIESFGHSCFRVSCEGKSVIFDPYEDHNVPGLKLPENLEADKVYCSHEHSDHNAAHLIHEKNPDEDPFPVSFLTVPHDHAGGSKRGMNRITKIKAGACTIVHMGDTGRLPEKEEYEALSDCDVLLIPAGGFFTIDAEEAAEIVNTVQPKLTILMHFRKGKRGYPVIADIRKVRKAFPCLEEKEETFLTFGDTAVPAGVITLEPGQ